MENEAGQAIVLDEEINVIENDQYVGQKTEPCRIAGQHPFLVNDEDGEGQRSHGGLETQKGIDPAKVDDGVHYGIGFPHGSAMNLQAGQNRIGKGEDQNRNCNSPASETIYVHIGGRIRSSASFASPPPMAGKVDGDNRPLSPVTPGAPLNIDTGIRWIDQTKELLELLDFIGRNAARFSREQSLPTWEKGQKRLRFALMLRHDERVLQLRGRGRAVRV
jgi:hypothetical protein